ncbi:putative glutathione-specific gamma-glutamylcyclotransferase 2 [Ischnura elegans]|uniref:putative glutathione-specific gamma-glutamylcyclotransferase 2 n=1 Tax=Ischnura elegans TaxID=197161 RepID=UPI001ED89CE0|nr:putative glutathione-specific gamma-glutamylcyclotransferase 2 [Ischnura elegans]
MLNFFFNAMWIFGYGSLIWKTDFPYETKCYGYITGYVRRFWQSSEDHRGVPGKPGRVVTLLPASDPEARVWGVAYKINECDVEAVSQHLDYREKDGYDKVTITFFPVICPVRSHCDVVTKLPEELPEPFQMCVYIGKESNCFFAGEAPLEDMARQILEAEGPSGTNREYLYQLAESTRLLFPQCQDEHLFQLEAAVKALDKNYSRGTCT